MSMGLLARPPRISEQLLSDQSYRTRSGEFGMPRLAAPPITMDAAQGFRIPFGGRGFFDFQYEPPVWFKPLLNQICELGDLSFDWDSYGARRIDPDTAAAAVSLALEMLTKFDPQPCAVPTSRGGVLLEWHECGVDLEIDIRSPSTIHVLFQDGDVEEEFENAELSIIREKLNLLRDRH